MNAKEIVEKKKTELAVMDYSQFSGEGVSADIDETDLILPQMLLMQGLSTLVANGDAKNGEIRDSLTGELLGDKNGPPKILIFGVKKSWEISVIYPGQKKAKWRESIPLTVANATWGKEEKLPNGETVVRHMQYNFTCLYTGRDFIQKETPYIVSLRGYSVRPAQKLCSYFMQLEQKNRPSFSRCIELVPTEKENDLGKFYIYDWRPGREATMEEMQACHGWRKRLKGQTVQTHNPNTSVAATPVSNDDDSDSTIQF